MIWQYILVGLVVCAAVLYAAKRIREVVLQRRDPCAGCSGCALREIKRKQFNKKETPKCHHQS